MLWVALELPALPLQIVERGGVSPTPLVISEGPAQRPLVACANRAAKAAGIREGQAVAAAKALAGELHVVARDEAGEREALERLAAWAGQFTPMVSLEADGHRARGRGEPAVVRGAREAHLGDPARRARAGLSRRPRHRAHAARRARVRESRGPGTRGARLPRSRGAARAPGRAAALPPRLAAEDARAAGRPRRAARSRRAGASCRRASRAASVPRSPPRSIASWDRFPIRARPIARRRASARAWSCPPRPNRSRRSLFPLRRLLAEFEGSLRARGAGVQQLALTLEHGRKARTRLAFEFASPEREADFILAIAREKLGRHRARRAHRRARRCAPTRSCRTRRARRPGFRARWSRPSGANACSSASPRGWAATASSASRWATTIARKGIGRPIARRSHALAAARRAGRARAAIRASRPFWLLHRPQRLVTQEGHPALQGALELRRGARAHRGGMVGRRTKCSRDYYVAANPRGETFWIYREHRDPLAWYLHGVFA